MNRKTLYIFLSLGTLLVAGFLFKEVRFRAKDHLCVESVNVVLVGDLLIGNGAVWREITEDKYKLEIVGDYLDTFMAGDMVVGNFEGIISRNGLPRAKNLPASFSIRTDPEIVNFFNNFKNPILLFANNHSADFGKEAMEDMLDILSGSSIRYVGVGWNKDEALSPQIIESKGIKIAFLAFTDLLPREYYASFTSGVAELTTKNLQKSISIAKSSSDFVIVSLHTAQSINEPFSFQPDSHQQLFSRLAIDYGADAVIGQHPHGLQAMEQYRGKPIFYSLGLFLYDPSVSERYAVDDSLYQTAQFKGGGILNLEICQNGLQNFNLIPIKVTKKDKNLVVTSNSLLGYYSGGFSMKIFNFLYDK